MPSTHPKLPATSVRSFLATVLVALAFLLMVPTGAASHPDGTQGGPDGCITFYYVIGGQNYTSLPTNLTPGAVIDANFNLGAECSHVVSFVSYNATAGFALPPQTVFSFSTGEFGPGNHSLQITVPPCYFQLDFVYGPVITQFNETSGTYHGGHRFIGGRTGGSECLPPTSSSSTTTTSETNTTTTEVPFFPSAVALSIGVGSLALVSFLMLRRRV